MALQRRKLGACLMGILVLVWAGGFLMRQAAGQERAGHASRTETPDGAAARRLSIPADITKTTRIEPPALALVKDKSTAAAAAGKAFVNTHVAPGRVHWHGTFAEACAAAQKSHKPVLLFHMMGKLDDLFC